MNTLAAIGFGANLGSKVSQIQAARQAVTELPNTVETAFSPLYKTAPHEASGPDYINAVAALQTTLSAPDLLLSLQALENGAGRERPYRNAPRTLDLDLLLYGDAGIASAHLTVPHPRMWERAFVLVPLAEVAPQCVSEPQLQAVADQGIEHRQGADWWQ